jgi:hypothetical protein
MSTRKPRAFFAIPCGEFYAIQADIIRAVCSAADVEPLIAEEDLRTAGLWGKICHQIESSDLFMADISSGSPNVIVELGYALHRKPDWAVGIFASHITRVPSDLKGFVLQMYASVTEFQHAIVNWLSEALPLPRRPSLPGPSEPREVFKEDFMDEDRFIRRWAGPPGSAMLLTPDGLRFGASHVPILTTTLSILQDCEFEFEGKIVSGALGWAVKGTKRPGELHPTFCVMFNLDIEGFLLPHVWNINQLLPDTHYHVYREKKSQHNIKRSAAGWFKLVTRVTGDRIQIENEKSILFDDDFSSDPYKDAYGQVMHKDGQVGFRCHPGEEAIVRHVRVKML